MSIKLIQGEPGAGKSLYVCKEVIDVIVNTDRFVITNMAFKLHPWMAGDKAQMGLLAYLEREYGETFDCANRFRFLEEEECWEFYRHRRNGGSVECSRDAKGHPISLDWATLGEKKFTNCEFVIDEFWKYAGSRDWSTTGKALIDWGKQHRKAGDNAWLMTHHHKDIDTAIQRIIETTVTMDLH